MVQSARILPIHVKEGVKRGKSTSFVHFRKRQKLGHEKYGKKYTKNAPLVMVVGLRLGGPRDTRFIPAFRPEVPLIFI